MFAGHETTANTVGLFADVRLWSIVTDSVVDIRPLGVGQEASHPRETTSGNHGNPGEDQGQG